MKVKDLIKALENLNLDNAEVIVQGMDDHEIAEFRMEDADSDLIVNKDGSEVAIVTAVDIPETRSFGWAIRMLKNGHKVTREGWNGKGMFLWLKPETTIQAEWCHDPKLKALAHANGGTIEALGTICMFTARKQILSGWLASQTDMLAEDWMTITD